MRAPALGLFLLAAAPWMAATTVSAQEPASSSAQTLAPSAPQAPAQPSTQPQAPPPTQPQAPPAQSSEQSSAQDSMQAPASAQTHSTAFSWRGRVTDEGATEQPNISSPFLSPTRGDAWRGSNDFIASVDGTWDWVQRVKLGGGLLLLAPFNDSSTDGPEVRVREAYGRVSVLPWLDVEAGKRLLRWGTGYAFTPTGLLDPPRDATDPTDRLGLNEGMVLARVDAFRGASAVTIAVAAPQLDRPAASIPPGTPRRLLALRARTTIAGVEVAAVASAADNRRASVGANFTHVIGRQFEYHGELLVHDDGSPWLETLAPHQPRTRRVSALAGMQYTFDLGLNAIVEYYRDGNGLSPELWSRLMDGVSAIRPAAAADASSAPASFADATNAAAATAAAASAASASRAASAAGTLTRPLRRDFLFLRGSRADTNAFFLPELIALVSLDDRGMTLVPTVRIAPTPHLQFYVRGVVLTGPARSADGSAPTASTVSAGATVLF